MTYYEKKAAVICRYEREKRGVKGKRKKAGGMDTVTKGDLCYDEVFCRAPFSSVSNTSCGCPVFSDKCGGYMLSDADAFFCSGQDPFSTGSQDPFSIDSCGEDPFSSGSQNPFRVDSCGEDPFSSGGEDPFSSGHPSWDIIDRPSSGPF